MAEKYRHIYAHLPFCDVICHYCDFYTARSSEARNKEFFAAIQLEAKSKLSEIADSLDAIYFGGGTPSVSLPEEIQAFLDLFRDRIDPKTEITLEANPTNVTREAVSAWRRAGVNRISIGIQSLDDVILKRLGRAHSAAEALAALETCLLEIPNVTGDLIYAVPGQKDSDPADHAMTMAEVGVKHFSAYHLTLAPTHFLHAKLPSDSFAFAQIQSVHERLGSVGFRHYEISNFAKLGFESKNNGNYWRGGSYLGLGPSAHGFDGDRTRWQNLSDWETYVAKALSGESILATREVLSDEQRKIEALFTGLRLDDGVDLAEIEKRFHCSIIEGRERLFAAWEKEGLGRLDKGRFLPTFHGRMLADEIVQRLL